MTLTLRWLLVAAVLTLSACASLQFGHQFDPRNFEDWVQPGQTTQQQVRAYLGEPVGTGVVLEHDGTRYQRWLYYFGKGRLSRMEDADFRMLEVRFDEQQRVVAYNWSASNSHNK